MSSSQIRKNTPEQIQRIVDALIYTHIIKGEPLRTIQISVNKNDDLTKQEKLLVLKKIREGLEEAADVDPKVIKGICITSMQHLYKKLYEEADYTGAMKALNNLFKLTNTEINDDIYPETETEEAEAENKP